MRAAAAPALICFVLAAPVLADEGARMDAVVAAAVRANYESLHGCYRKQLARDRSKGGSLILRLTLGPADSVSGAAAGEDRLKNADVTRCVLGWVRGWTLRGAAAAGADEGSQVLLPLSFQAAPEQFVVRRDDTPETAMPGGSVRVLLDDRNAGARAASLRLVEAVSSLPGRVFELSAGDAAWCSPATGAGTVDGTMTLLLLQVPGAPAEKGRGEVVPARGKGARRRAAAAGRPQLTPLLQPRNLRHRRFTLGLVEARPGATLSASQAELLYIVGGNAEARLGKASEKVGAAQALAFPDGQPHSVTAGTALRAVQVFVPGGPDDRERGGR